MTRYKVPSPSAQPTKHRRLSTATEPALTGTAAGVKMPNRKGERTHEENQERAYIAASRRSDRSLEARVQSARMASELHFKRTGRRLKITEQGVANEDMYEEEEPARRRAPLTLAMPHYLITGNPTMDARTNSWFTTRLAVSAYANGLPPAHHPGMQTVDPFGCAGPQSPAQLTQDQWSEAEIHRQFSNAFPNANLPSQQLTQSPYTDHHGSIYSDGSEHLVASSRMSSFPASPTWQQHGQEHTVPHLIEGAMPVFSEPNWQPEGQEYVPGTSGGNLSIYNESEWQQQERARAMSHCVFSPTASWTSGPGPGARPASSSGTHTLQQPPATPGAVGPACTEVAGVGQIPLAESAFTSDMPGDMRGMLRAPLSPTADHRFYGQMQNAMSLDQYDESVRYDPQSPTGNGGGKMYQPPVHPYQQMVGDQGPRHTSLLEPTRTPGAFETEVPFNEYLNLDEES